jgi:MFS family permease
MPPTPRHDPLAALRERNYRFFVIGWLPASAGLQMQATALAWEVYERTHDPLALGIMGLARALPTVALSLPAGQIVDMVDRRRVLVATQVGFAVTGGLLALGSVAWDRGLLGPGNRAVWVIYFLVALTGCARVFNGPSRSSLLPLLIRGGPHDPVFHNAVTWNSGVFQLAATLGPIAAGALIARTGNAWPVYAVAAASCLWFGVAAAFLRPYPAPGVAPRPPGRLSLVALWNLVRPAVLLPGMLEGVRHIRRERTVLGAIALDLFAVLLGGATALLPVYAADILHVGPVGLGALKAAPYVGALLIAFFMARRPPMRHAGPALLGSVAAFGFFTVIFGLSTDLWLSLAMLAALGAVDNVSVVIRHVLVAVRTPDHLRGRVSAVNSVFIECSNEVGGFESGLVARLLGPVFSVVAGGLGTIAVVIVTAIWLPELRRLGRLTRQADAPPEA